MVSIIIKCKGCSWKPLKDDEWQCSCRYVWNTFDTGGECPQCKKRWEITQCLHCRKFSPHLDWYSGYDKLLKTELENINVELVLEK